MITRAVLNAKRESYIQERERISAEAHVFNGAIGAIDDLLTIMDKADAAREDANIDAATDAAKENTDG